MKITDMFKDSVDLKIDVESLDGRPFKFSYRPSLLTNQVRLATGSLMDMVDVMADGLVCEWDVQDDEGNDVEISRDTILLLPAAVAARMFSAMEAHSLDTKNLYSLSAGNGRAVGEG